MTDTEIGDIFVKELNRNEDDWEVTDRTLHTIEKGNIQLSALDKTVVIRIAGVMHTLYHNILASVIEEVYLAKTLDEKEEARTEFIAKLKETGL